MRCSDRAAADLAARRALRRQSAPTAEQRRQALLRLDGVTCPVRVYDQIVNADIVGQIDDAIAEAEERGWTID